MPGGCSTIALAAAIVSYLVGWYPATLWQRIAGPTLHHARQQRSQRTPTTITPTTVFVDAVIIGAGWAGMAAADTLVRSNANVTNFVVLESTDRTGGRSHSKPFGDPGIWRGVVEGGSNWVCGVAPYGVQKGGAAGVADGMADLPWESPLATLARKAKLGMVRVVGSADGNMTGYDEVYRADGSRGDIGYNIRERAQAGLDCLNATDANASTNSTVRQGLVECGWMPKTDEEWAVDWAMSGEDADGEVADRLSQRSFLPDPTYQWWGGDDMFVVDQHPRGYARLLDAMVADTVPPGDSRVVFNTRVTNIKYGTEGVIVTASDGRKWHAAREVICTLPLGTLQRHYRTLFDPPISKDAESVLTGGLYVMGNLTHVVAQFPTVWWDNSLVKWLQTNGGTNMSQAPNAAAGELAVWHNLNHERFLPGSQTLLSFYGDPQSSRYEAMPTRMVQAEFMKRVRLQHPGVTIPDPTDFYISRHGYDGNSYGAYSISLAGWIDSMHADLGQPLKDAEGRVRVRLAGEAMCPNLHGYTHGALQTGLESAAWYLHDQALGPVPTEDPRLNLCNYPNKA